ncbi:hypothetical protein OIU34_02470 [Pararhizobium sp. BT-229]|uniref:hypothetical protein n=1 Tax=Pararhizobium sp. BT-229 TaxID=2986923 RepID=UPI0021F7E54D|nr:hypothetical protein [Pararhizobium sp. BT-229]MCV9960752.1 hypothetical protein [Pararhizobium sp. BT-229]
MPSQHSSRMRMPCEWESARQRHQREAAEELAAYLVEADALRARLSHSRIIEANHV